MARIEERLKVLEQRLGLPPAPATLGVADGAAATGDAPSEEKIPFATPVAQLPKPAAAGASASVGTGAHGLASRAAWATRDHRLPQTAPPPIEHRPVAPQPPASAGRSDQTLGPIEYQPAPPPPPPQLPARGVEQTLGLKWAGWVGAIVLVISVGLGLKYAYDNGWFGYVPNAVKFIVMWLGGFSLLAIGEAVYRKVNRLSAVGFFGAGVASLFLVSYAGHGFLEMYEPTTAFLLMAASTLVGAAVAMRGKLVSIAFLALLGGNLAPLLLGGRTVGQPAFFVYLLALQLTALVLAWWGAKRRWWALRGFSLATTAIWATVGIIAVGAEQSQGWPTLFVLLFGGLFQVELIVSAAMRRAGPKTGLVFSTLATTATAAGVTLCFHASTDLVRGAWLIGIGATAALAAMLCWWLSRRDPERRGLSTLATGYAVHAAILLVAAVPVAFTGWAVTFGWAALAVAFAAVGVGTGSRIARRCGAVIWFFAFAHFWQYLQVNFAALSGLIWFQVGPTTIPAYFVVAVIISAVGHAVAGLLRTGIADNSDACREMTRWQLGVQCFAGLTLAGAAIVALPALGATLALLAYAWTCALGDLFVGRRHLAWHAAGAVTLAMCKWTVIDLLAWRVAVAAPAPLVLNPAMLVGVMVAASLAGIFLLRRRTYQAVGENPGTLAWSVAVAILAMATVGLSSEIDRAVTILKASGTNFTFPPMQTQMLLLTVLWSAAAAGVIGVSRWLQPAMKLGGLALTLALILATKFAFVDTFGFRIDRAPASAMVLANLQVLAGACSLAIVVWACWVNRRESGSKGAYARVLAAIAVGLAWLLGTIEVDRWAELQRFAPAWMARQAGWSVWWSVFAAGAIALGFKQRVAELRYLGLGLFAVVCGKVVLIDLAVAGAGFRILSFFGLGVLLLGTSVLYGKVSPKLLGEE